MKAQYLSAFIAVQEYLESKKAESVPAFQRLIQKAIEDAAEWVTLSFTYEHIEGYAKIQGQIQLYEHLFETLSQSHIDEISRVKYNDENPIEDFEYWAFMDLIWNTIKLWIANCFHEAKHVIDIETQTKFYFKLSHDSMEILSLLDLKNKFERSEFDLYFKNNASNKMDLLGNS